MSKQLSHLQLDFLRVLWRKGEATVSEVHSEMQEERGLAPTTVATVLSRLERDGVVSHRLDGRQFVYRACVTEDEVRSSAVSDLAQRVFEGDMGALVSHLLRESDIHEGDLEQVRAILKAKEEGDDSPDDR